MKRVTAMLLPIITLTGCASLMSPPSGTHYKLKYGEVEVEVADYTDREGVQFEYVNGDTKVKLKKDSVDSATPAAILQQRQAENQDKALGIIQGLIKQ